MSDYDDMGCLKCGYLLCRCVPEPRKAKPINTLQLLFLDVDGVLNDLRSWPNKHSPILQENVTHLNTILAAVPEAQIVLSSAWRYRFSTVPVVEALLCVHNVNAVGRVHGVTEPDPVHDRRPFDDAEWWAAMGLRWRVAQIKKYVHGDSDIAPFPGKRVHYAVLDDLPLVVPHLFQTDPCVGLTAEIAEEVVEHFQRCSAPLMAVGGAR